MSEFQKWMADVEAANYSVDDILNTLECYQKQRDLIMEDYAYFEEKLKEERQRLSLVLAKKRYFELKLEKVAR